MSKGCGCCSGIEVVTPQSVANRPGLGALSYRAGTHATFFESMLARIASLYLDVPVADGSGTLDRVYPLSGLALVAGKLQKISSALSTRDVSDPSIALLDAWATVADVLTFYQERIANEGYLRTAVERRSVMELARLVGYRLRPGVSSSVYLAFTVADGFNGVVPSGTRAQSVPGVGQKPQPFETADDLPARDVWNNLKPRLTRPQVITLAADPDGQVVTVDQGTDAATRDTLYFTGIATNLKIGDALLVVSGDGRGQQCLRFVRTVVAQPDQQRTEVTLQEPALAFAGGGGATHALQMLSEILNPFIEDAATLFDGGDLATDVANILRDLLTSAGDVLAAKANATATDVAALIGPSIAHVQDKHDIAVRRGFSRLEPWIGDVGNNLTSLAERLPGLDNRAGAPPQSRVPITGGAAAVPPSLGRLFGIVDRLALPPSLQPANTFRLGRQVPQLFAPESDIAPRLLAAFKPAAAKTLYQAWGSVETAPSAIQVFAMRSKAAPFGNNAPLKVHYAGSPPSAPIYTDWPILEDGPIGTVATTVSHETDNLLFLDSANDKVLPGSWVVIDTTGVDTSQTNVIPSPGLQYVKAGDVKSVSRADYGMSGKTTRIVLVDPVGGFTRNWIDSEAAVKNGSADFIAIRETVVYAQPEELDLAEEPLDLDVSGNTIELDGLYDGLESGRWIIVSGQRTDISDASGSTNSTGVTGNELVMISAVTQGPGKQSCMPVTVSSVPFSNLYSIAGPNPAGDLLVVGEPNTGFVQFLNQFPLPNAGSADQEICNPIELAPGLFANAYVPTTDEKSGNFSQFDGLILDPDTKQPFPDGQIPITRVDPGLPSVAAVFAWRIRSLASGADTLHTNLVLANRLAYSYDSATVTVYGNVAKATHGQSQGEVLGNGDGGQAFQQFQLHQSPLTYLPAPTPSGAESTLVVRVNDIAWEEADNLFALTSSDREFITQTDDSDTTTVTFGDGVHGLRVPTGNANVKATYRSGTGQAGNVDAGQISQLATQPLGVKGVINPLAAAGGADGDTRDQARRNVPIGLTALDRLLSVQDYADFARRFAGIGKASARRLTDGRRIVVHLTIAGKDDVPIDPTTDLYAALVQALALAGDPNQPVQIAQRRLKVMVISAGVRIQSAYTWESVAVTLRSTLLALYSFDNRELGQSAFMSEAVSAMQAVAGVEYVDIRIFDAVSEAVTEAQLAGLATTLSPNSFVEAELSHVDPTALDPAGRIVPAELVILTPDIPDTLILTEITT